MTDITKLGLKCGLEIHQQLDTKKLFCDCPSIIREDEPHFSLTRELRARAGESGDTDQAALHESRKKKRFCYKGYEDTTCLVELDEEPPHPLNQDALSVGVQVAKMMGTHIFDKAQVMRKTVIDGSNTSGFQRTMLFGIGGSIGGDWGEAGVQTVCLEEDSAKILERGQEIDSYNLSRLGIPLLEIATDPDLTTPTMVRDAAQHIGLLLRSTRKVKRGLGTIRQDVNVSIKEGSRVEVKGAQDLKMIPTLVENEALRQHGLVNLKSRKISSGKVLDVTKDFSGAKGFIGKLIEKKQSVVGVKLEKGAGLLGTELFSGYRFGTELAGYAKANGFGGIIHSDEDEKKYGVDFVSVAKRFSCKKEDSWFVLVGNKEKIVSTIEHVLIPRIKQLKKGVPSEVRKANADGTTTYLRPMPGAARMYPETDIPLVTIDKDVEVPKLLTDQITDFAKQHKLPEALAKEAIETPLFEKLVERFPKVPAVTIAEAIITTPKEIKKRENNELTQEQLEIVVPGILEKINDIPKSAIYELLVNVAKGKELDFSKYKKADEKEVEKVVKEVVAADPDAPIGALMGQAMAKLRGKADGKLVMQLLQKHK